MLSDTLPLLREFGGSPRGQAIATGRNLASFAAAQAGPMPRSLVGAGLEAVQHQLRSDPRPVQAYLRSILEARERNRANLRGLFWALRELERAVADDPSDREAEQFRDLVRSFLADAWRCPDPPQTIRQCEVYARTACRLEHNVVLQAVTQQAPQQPEPERGRRQ